MPRSSFECMHDFKRSLLEVETVLMYARRSQHNRLKYASFAKSVVVLLAAKFEAFLEDSISEYIESVEKLELSPNDFPEVLKLHCLDRLIDEKFISDVRGHKSEALEAVARMSGMCHGNDVVASIDIDSKFNYGKHGEKEITKLYSRIGIVNVFESCKISWRQEMLSSETAVSIPISVAPDVNALTAIRNKVLHGDEDVGVSCDQLEGYEQHLVLFCAEITSTLEQMVADLELLRDAKRRATG